MKYREARRRVKFLKSCGYKRVKPLANDEFFKQWDMGESHVRLICPWSIVWGDYWKLVGFIEHAEKHAENLLEEEIRIFRQDGL